MAISLAKVSVIKPNILNFQDIEKLVNEHSSDTGLASIMEVSSIKILQCSDYLYFIIKYQKPSLRCGKMTIFPVQKNGTTWRKQQRR